MVPERLKKITLMKVGEGWKETRNDWFNSRYRRGATPLEEIVADVPDGVPVDQWEKFVTWKAGPVGRQRSQRGVHARDKQKVHHTAGSRTFASNLHEMVIIQI